jgi:anaerobic magnesium-protoporphyrin IX monomethyl ester cyclase
MKVLLVNPWQDTKYPQPPLGLAMISAVLEKNGYPVKVLDASALKLTEISILNTIQREKPDIIGITAMTPTINSAIKIARQIKELHNDVIIVLGGPHVTLFPEETLKRVPEADIVVQGEGEQTMVELVETLENGNSVNTQVSGVTYREKNCIQSSPTRQLISDLDSLPFPAFHLLPMAKYRLHPPHGRKLPSIPIITSRGCPYRCIYCSKSVFGRQYRANSPAYVVNEIEHMMDKFNAREITFYDDSFTLDKKRAVAICEELQRRRIDIPWTCETRVNLVNEELIEKMKKAGCYMIAFGVESGAQKILNTLKKDITLEQATRAFELTHKIGIQTIAYFMIGSPNETPETIKQTIEFAKKLDPDFVQFSIVTPYPGTELYSLAFGEGNSPEKWDTYVYADLNSVSNATFETKTMSRQELGEWTKKAYTSFYLRWRYVWKRLSKMNSLGELRTNTAGLRMLTDLII